MSHRVIYAVRHAEREDNINRNWQKQKDSNPYGLKSDNTPISKRGKFQADELNKKFNEIPITHVFASPFDRTIETATRLIGSKDIPIKVEPGFAEVSPIYLDKLFKALYLCESPPGFEALDVVKKKYPKVDMDYNPIFKPPLPKEDYSDEACTRRVKKTIELLLERYTEPDEIIVIVGHGASIGATHDCLIKDWAYVGQATVSKFVEDPKKAGKFVVEYSGDSSHLSDPTNLRAY